MNRFICIHGHFYQPPRENPWLEEVELEDSAYPYHDWNMRITSECYAPNALSRILDSNRRIIDIVNNYSKISFNFGSTLLSWIQRHSPETYQVILEADKKSQEIFSGHGSALAQVYNHIIMPLANSRDKRTQIIWGIKDFRHRFKRDPEGMWLAETAVDLETLDLLAEYNIKFTILAPSQAQKIRKIGEEKWLDVSGGKIDPRRPYLCRLPSGRTIAIFFYDGPLSQEIAFGNLLDNGENLAKRLLSLFSAEGPNSEFVHIATDGETYGHHHRFGDMALAYCLYYLESNNLAKITIYGEYLENNPPRYEVEIFENSSWSCFHGVQRWQNNCGCNSGMHRDWNQQWRAPLRGALDWLRDNLIQIFEGHISSLIIEPWKARDDFIEVILDRSVENAERFLSKYRKKELTKEEKIKALRLLEMQRHTMLMYTSCGWFFDEISGVETVQILKYVARAIQLAREVSGISLEETFVGLLERAPSNILDFKNGAKAYELFVKPGVLDLLRVAVHFAVSSLFKKYEETSEIYSYTVKTQVYDLSEMGKQRLSIGRLKVYSRISWEEEDISFVVVYFGDQNLIGAAKTFMGEEAFLLMQKEIKDSFIKGEAAEIIHLIDRHFKEGSYSLWHLFKDEQRRVLNQIFDSTLKEINTSFRQIYEHHSSIMQVAGKLNMPLPKPFVSVAEFVLNWDIRKCLEAEELDVARVGKFIDDIKRFGLSLDKDTFNFMVSNKIETLMEKFFHNSQDLSRTCAQVRDLSILENIVKMLEIIEVLSLDLNLWKAQNLYFFIGKQFFIAQQENANKGDEIAKKWIGLFNRLGDYLKVRVV